MRRRTAALLLELSETIERLENAVKIVGARPQPAPAGGGAPRLRLRARRETVPREQRLVADVNELIGGVADRGRGEWMELAVVAPIAFEIVAALR